MFFSTAIWAIAQTDETGDTPEVSESRDYPDAANASRQQRPDPPSRVARLQYSTGAVSIQPSGQGDWVEGSLNRPLTSTDNIWTDKNARAELNTGTALLRMGSETSMTLTSIVDQTVQVQLHQGAMNLHIRHLYNGEIYEIDTPNMAFTVQKSGDYRFDVDPNGDASVVTVWRGEGDATGNGPSVRVRSKEQARFVGGTSMVHSVHEAPALDSFDEWCVVRDRREDHSVSARYVSPGVIGSEDLDHYGTWREVPPYGPVWAPAVAPGWAPYQYGHWVWVEPWGWTWVDDAPWGFAPFHYGRWVYYNNYWGWVPGPVFVRPVYAPALVTFFGGSNFFVGASFGFGGIGWCPLGFGEPFFPFFPVSRTFFTQVNITNTRIVNITNVTNNFFNGHKMPPQHYANLHVRNGFTAVSRDTMINSREVNRNTIAFRGNELRNVQAVNRVPFQPTRTSRLGINAGRPAVAPSPRIAARPVVSRIGSPSIARNGGPVARIGNNGGRELPRGVENPGAGRIATPQRTVPRPPQRGESVNARNGSAPTINRGPQTGPTNRGPEAGPTANRGPQSGPLNKGSVPRPPESGSVGGNRGLNNSPRAAGPSVPRPRGPVNSPRTAQGPRSAEGPRSVPAPSNPPRSDAGGRNLGPRSVPRPEGGRAPQPTRSEPSRSGAVPRPTGRVMPARDAGPVGGFGSRSSRPEPMGPRGGFGQSPRPSMSPRGGFGQAPSMGSRGGFGQAPSMGSRGGSGEPRMSAPQRSAPAPRMSQPSFGGGGGGHSSGRSAPSGGGSRSGGHQSQGGRRA